MPQQLPRIMLSIDQTTEEVLDYLTDRYGLSRSALVRLALRRMAEAEGWEKGKAAAWAFHAAAKHPRG